MKTLKEHQIKNAKISILGYQQDDGSWGGHAQMTRDFGSYIESRKIYPNEKTYLTKEELIKVLEDELGVD
ncbi:MAG: hypothetical protein H6863_06285 [Rhodospirillales bacterium]|nr:hypothetical protein [Rhodospirillales bacterium]